MSASRKRKNRPGKTSFVPDDLTDPVPPDTALFIQAYEADILRGPQAKQAAESLDVAHHLSHRGERSALIQWNPSNFHTAPAFPSEVDDGFASSSPDRAIIVNNSVWVDRYDARLLLDSLPKQTSISTPASPTGWSDLPSDSEDTFFFAPHEADDYRREKRRKLMDQAREERVKARRAEDGESEEEDVWGGSDEEPDEVQAELMERTAASISATDNPAQLEMRILANYGGDKRFAFLRGRWKLAWNAMKRKAQEDQEARKSTTSVGGLGNLADYGDSDEDADEDEHEGVVPDPQAKEEAALAARQARAKAWAESRRASKSDAS
ncbi:hypothetical protein DFH06DRAFT_1184918 [Mycena polygramma]|nr:hypothetical protein DFH06DRAFT_1184918 [Mycena polygramma]